MRNLTKPSHKDCTRKITQWELHAWEAGQENVTTPNKPMLNSPGSNKVPVTPPLQRNIILQLHILFLELLITSLSLWVSIVSNYLNMLITHYTYEYIYIYCTGIYKFMLYLIHIIAQLLLKLSLTFSFLSNCVFLQYSNPFLYLTLTPPLSLSLRNSPMSC